MNKREGISKRTIIILVIIMVLAVAMMMLMINYGKDLTKSKPVNSGVVEEKTTPTTTQPMQETIHNFAISLSDIIKNEDFSTNYKYTSYYEGAKFDFNCTNYSEDEGKCLEGSALMSLSETLMPLFVYQNSEDNYFLHAKDFYIMVDDNYIILVSNTVPKKSGVIKIYDRKGNHLTTIDNALTGYVLDNKTYDALYPNITDNRLYFYTWHNKKVEVASIDLKKISEGNSLEIKYEEMISGATLKN